MKLTAEQKAVFAAQTQESQPAIYQSAMGYMKRKFGNRKAPATVEETYNAIHHVKYALERNRVNAASRLSHEFHDHAAERQDWHNAGFDA
jgi:hypothetical protein